MNRIGMSTSQTEKGFCGIADKATDLAMASSRDSMILKCLFRFTVGIGNTRGMGRLEQIIQNLVASNGHLPGFQFQFFPEIPISSRTFKNDPVHFLFSGRHLSKVSLV